MSISFESAVETLKIMFPGWDEDTLSAILVSNNYHVENTIETVLSMSGEEETPSSAVTPMPANSAPIPPQPSTGNLIDVDGSSTTKLSQSSMDSSAAVGKPPASLPTPSSSSSSSNSSSSQYRGLRVELPFDFLRPPGWVGSEQTIADEDLARMLQNEMFQQEAMRVEGGAELIAMMQRSNAQNRLRQQQQQQQHRHQQQQQHQHPSSINSNTQRRPSHPASASATAGHSNEPVDLGIMKALNTMGIATKQSLSQLAQAFKSKTPPAASSSSSSSSDSDIHSSSTSGGNAASSSSSSPQQSMIRSPPKQPKSKRGSNTFQSLDDQEINHEDIYGENDNVEVITFGSPSSNQHMLHGADDVNGDDDDAENPLLRQRGVYNNDNVNLNKKSY